MTYAILSDPHANADALRRVLADAQAQGADAFVCLGDIVGYGPLPAETLSLVRARCAVVVAGNHDDAVSGRMNAQDFIGLAGDAVDRHRVALAADDLRWLASLPHTVAFAEAAAAHGDFTEPAAFPYVENADDAAAEFAATEPPLLFVGHTHVPALYVKTADGAVSSLPPQDFALEPGMRYLVNPGSVGYPRESDGKCLSSYVLYDATARTVRYRYLPFSVASVMQRGPAARRVRVRYVALPLALALAFGLVALWRGGGTSAPAPSAVPASAVDAGLAVTNVVLRLAPETRKVRANLVLERDSAPVMLVVTFRDRSGGELAGGFVKTVKRSHQAAVDIPAGAVRAAFDVRRLHPDDPVRLKSCAPAAVPGTGN